MLTLDFLIFSGLFVLLLLAVALIRGCDSGMRLLNADWLRQEERFHLISRWGIRL